jgi:site-specific DNA recombinase
MKQAILYTRVSSQAQVDEGNSLPRQKKLGYEYAEQNGYKLAEHFEEEGESAKTTNRPALKRMLEYVGRHRGEIDTLLIYKVDRLSRDVHDYLALKQLFEKNGIAIVSMSENFDDTPIGRVMETIASSFSQYDNEVRAERSKGGMVDGIKEGRWQWKAPTGYINTKVEGKKNIAPDPRRGYKEALRSAWSLIDNGCSMSEARRLVNVQLQELGIKTIPNQTFSSMLRKKIYKGVACGFGLEVQSKTIVPIVEPELFDRVELILTGHKNAGKNYSKINPDFPLRGVLRDKNGHKLTGSHPRGNGGSYSKYHCPKCKGQGISYNVTEVEERFLQYTEGMKLKNDVRDALREAVSLNLGDTQKQNDKTSRTLNKRLTVIKAEKKELTLKNIKGVVSDATAQELLLDYEGEETEIRLKLNHLSTGMEDVEELLEFGLEKLTNLAQTFQTIEDANVRSRFQKWLFPAGLDYDGEKFGTSQLPLIYRVKQNTLAGALSNSSALVTLPGIEPGLPD